MLCAPRVCAWSLCASLPAPGSDVHERWSVLRSQCVHFGSLRSPHGVPSRGRELSRRRRVLRAQCMCDGALHTAATLSARGRQLHQSCRLLFDDVHDGSMCAAALPSHHRDVYLCGRLLFGELCRWLLCARVNEGSTTRWVLDKEDTPGVSCWGVGDDAATAPSSPIASGGCQRRTTERTPHRHSEAGVRFVAPFSRDGFDVPCSHLPTRRRAMKCPRWLS